MQRSFGRSSTLHSPWYTPKALTYLQNSTPLDCKEVYGMRDRCETCPAANCINTLQNRRIQQSVVRRPGLHARGYCRLTRRTMSTMPKILRRGCQTQSHRPFSFHQRHPLYPRTDLIVSPLLQERRGYSPETFELTERFRESGRRREKRRRMS